MPNRTPVPGDLEILLMNRLGLTPKTTKDKKTINTVAHILTMGIPFVRNGKGFHGMFLLVGVDYKAESITGKEFSHYLKTYYDKDNIFKDHPISVYSAEWVSYFSDANTFEIDGAVIINRSGLVVEASKKICHTNTERVIEEKDWEPEGDLTRTYGYISKVGERAVQATEITTYFPKIWVITTKPEEKKLRLIKDGINVFSTLDGEGVINQRQVYRSIRPQSRLTVEYDKRPW